MNMTPEKGLLVFLWTGEPSDTHVDEQNLGGKAAFAHLVRVHDVNQSALVPPIVDLEMAPATATDKADVRYFVPHRSHVPHAANGFYTFTANVEELG